MSSLPDGGDVRANHSVTVEQFRSELAERPEALSALADRVSRHDPYAALPSLLDEEPAGVLLLGVGGARYACDVAASRIRMAGIGAVAEYASAARSFPPSSDILVVAVAVEGGLREVCGALEAYTSHSPIIVLTDAPTSPVARYADVLVPVSSAALHGEPGRHGYQNALALLLLLGQRLGAPSLGTSNDLTLVMRRAANASQELLERAPTWVPRFTAALDSPTGPHFLAPAERLCSAQHAALALRQGPVLAAHAFETGEWSHTGRYLAAISDYRAVLFTGSQYDERVSEHLRQLHGTFVAVGGTVEGAAAELRYLGDGDADIRLLTEPLVGELLAAHWWAQRGV